MSDPANKISVLHYFSAGLLVAAEAYHVVDRDWTAYQAVQSFIFVQYVVVIVGFAVQNEKGETLGHRIYKFANLFGVLTGIGALALMGWAVDQCTRTLTSTQRHDASNCIDKYKSYAALDGPYGVTNGNFVSL
tara:strand:- start:284 stop:682 length:399 start_codon:yes stop_codon:yes gene_type:complete